MGDVFHPDALAVAVRLQQSRTRSLPPLSSITTASSAKARRCGTGWRRFSATGCSSATAKPGGAAADRCADRARLAFAAVRAADGPGRDRNRRSLGECRARAQPINALTEMATLTAEIICRTVFGRQLGARHAAEIIDAFSEYQRLIGQLDLAYFIGLPDWLPRFHSPAIHRAAKRIHKVLDQVIRDCRERLSSGEPSMIRLLLEARDPETGEPLDETALRNEAAVIFMAGHETTANSLAWSWYLLSQSPEVEERLHAELAQVLAGRPPNSRRCSPADLYAGSIRRNDTALPSCSAARPASAARRDDPRPPRTGGIAGHGRAMAAPPSPQILGKARPLHSRSVFARERPIPGAARLPAVQRWAPHLRRGRLRPHRGGPVHCDARPARPAPPRARLPSSPRSAA